MNKEKTDLEQKRNINNTTIQNEKSGRTSIKRKKRILSAKNHPIGKR